MSRISDNILNRTVRRGECLEWSGSRTAAGYGRMGIDGEEFYVHRMVCEDAHGPAPADKPLAIHSCDNPPCVNPAHLRWGSKSDNAMDMVSRGRGGQPHGENHPRATLTELRVRLARRLHARGAPLRPLARWFGVDNAGLLRAVRGDTWRHV